MLGTQCTGDWGAELQEYLGLGCWGAEIPVHCVLGCWGPIVAGTGVHWGLGRWGVGVRGSWYTRH